MCYHIIQSKLRKQIERRFKAKFNPESSFTPSTHLNGFDFPSIPIITNDKREIIQDFNWGFIPEWSKSKDIRAVTLNAKIETLHEKPSFKHSVQQRCLILANGFYEWQWRDTKGKNKVKYQIGIEGDALFAFAGLYSHWHNDQTNEIVNTCTIVTTEANPLMATIHNIKKRMPVILRAEDEINWLHQEPVDQFAYPYEVDLVAKNLDVQNELLLF